MKKKYTYAILLLFVIAFIKTNGQSIYRNKPVFKTGDIICSFDAKLNVLKTDSLFLSATTYSPYMVGVYLEDTSASRVDENYICTGIAYVKCNNENGMIKKDDFITTSAQKGAGMKAVKSGFVLGVALEDASSESGLIKTRILIQYVKQ